MKLGRRIADLIHRVCPGVAALISVGYGFMKRPNKSYSLHGEDFILADIFRNQEPGIYLDIGAFHAKWISNTYLLAKNGWSGCAVDIDREKLLSFKFRSGCITKLGAVVPADCVDKFVTIYKFDRVSSELDTTLEGFANYYKEIYGYEYKENMALALPIDQLIDEVMQKFSSSKIDYLGLDIEGADEKIILSINPGQYGVKVIQFESNTHFRGGEAIERHLEKCGYLFYATTGGTHTFVDVKLIETKFCPR